MRLSFQVGALLLAVSWASPVLAQSNRPRADASLSGALWIEDGHYSGVDGSLAWYPRGGTGLVLDVGYFNNFALNPTLLGGVRVPFKSSTVRPFMQVLVGRTPVADIAFLGGGGVDFDPHAPVAIRVTGDVSYSGDDGSTFWGFKFAAGVVWRFGG